MFASICLSTVSAHAQTTNWTGGTGSWFVGGNWSNGVPTTIESQINVANGGTVQINGGVANGGVGSTLSITNAGSTVDVQTGGSLFTGTLNIDSGGTLLLSGSTAVSAANLVNLGGGTLRSTVTGVFGDDLRFAPNVTSTITASGGQTLTLNGSLFDITNNNPHIVFGSSTDTGTVVVAPTILTSSNIQSSVDVAGGTLRVGNPVFASILAFTTMTVHTGATLDLNDQDGNVFANLFGNGHVLTGVNSTTSLFIFAGSFSGQISGAGQLAKADNGTLTLSGVNTYAGGTVISSGTLQLAGAGTLGNVANSITLENTTNPFLVGFGSPTILDLGGSNQIENGGLTLIAGTIQNGTLSSSGAFDVRSGAVSAALAGSGALTKSTTGTVTLSGDNSYTGATIVNGGVLFGGAANVFSPFSATSINGFGTLDLGGFAQTINTVLLAGGTIQNGSLTGAVTSTGGTINGLGGSATVTTIGGITTVIGSNTYTGNTTVNGGILSVNGSIASSPMTVNAGGTLSGIGTVSNTTIASGGAFAPGSGTPGSSMAVAGSLALQSGAMYVVMLNPTTASFANVTGAAMLGGATVNAIYASGGYISKQYTILTATGGRSGTFSSLINSNLSANFTTSLSYDPTHAYLNLTLAPNGLNINQRSVANTLTNFFNTSGGVPMVFGALSPASLSQASGESATGSQQTTFQAMTQFLGTLLDPFTGGRGDNPVPGGATSYADEDDASAYASDGKPHSKSERDAYAAVYRKAQMRSTVYDPRWSVWAAGFGGSQTTDGNGALGSNSATSRIFGTAVGADYWLSPRTVMGFALAGGGTSFSVANGGSGHSDLFQAGAFVRHTVGSAYLSGALAYGWQDVTTNRTVSIAGIDQLQARFNASAYSGRVEGGYRFVTPIMGGIGLTPYAAAQFTTFDLPAYAEQALVGANTFALAYGARDVTDSRSEVGIRTDKSFAMQDAILTLRGRFAWAHDFDPDRSIGATFQTLPGASFVVNGAAQAADSALTTASAELKWTNNWSVAGTFEGEFSSVTASYAGKGVVRYAW